MTSLNSYRVYLFSVVASLCLLLSGTPVKAQNKVINFRANDLLPHSEIQITPRSGTFQENSTFDVPIFLNTRKNSVNAIELHVKFDPNKLSVVKPSGGKSIIGIWVDPPSYDNIKGNIKAIGTIPGGITSDSGLILTITFKAKTPGQTIVQIVEPTQVLMNDGLGTPTILESTRGNYSIVPQPPGGVTVYSDTHPFQDRWYNNNSPVLSWNRDADVDGFSYTFDTNPNTIPENKIISSATTTISFANTGDGLWYFHIKAHKRGVWGNTTHYAIRIDTVPPAEFTPTIEYITATVINRFLLTFFTTDSLSGINHYEVGAINKSEETTVSPTFIETESPYQIPMNASGQVRVIVRAFDNAGNIRDESLDVEAPFMFIQYIINNSTKILISILFLIMVLLIVHYLYGHHIIKRIKKIMALLRKEKV